MFTELMNILITGACGYIGSHFTNLISKSGKHNLFAIDNLSTGFRNAIPGSVELLCDNLENTKNIDTFIRDNNIDTIFHFAGKIIVSESIKKPYLYYKSNTINTCNLANIASKSKVKFFIFSSTAAVYAQPPDNRAIDEDCPTQPLSPYGASKLMSERIISDIFAGTETKYANLRYFNVAGAALDNSNGQRSPNSTHLIKMCCKAVLNDNFTLSIFGNNYNTKDGTGIRDYIHIEDLTEAHLQVLKYLKNGGNSQVFNIGYGRGYSVFDVIKSIEKVAGKKLKYQIKDKRPGDAAAIVSSNKKIISMTSWRPKFDNLDIITKTTLDWELKIKASNEK